MRFLAPLALAGCYALVNVDADIDARGQLDTATADAPPAAVGDDEADSADRAEFQPFWWEECYLAADTWVLECGFEVAPERAVMTSAQVYILDGGPSPARSEEHPIALRDPGVAYSGQLPLDTDYLPGTSSAFTCDEINAAEGFAVLGLAADGEIGCAIYSDDVDVFRTAAENATVAPSFDLSDCIERPAY